MTTDSTHHSNSAEPEIITVLMPAYNAAGTIESAVRSVIDQTWKHWELLVVNDGSTDGTQAIVEKLAAGDSRIRIYNAPQNAGLCASLNLGLSLISTRYVARMDADDICYPTRLARQMDFLSANPDVKVLGTYGERVNTEGKKLTALEEGPTSRAEYVEYLEQHKVFFLIHSSVIFDREIVLAYGGYQQDDYPAEDVSLWTRIAKDYLVLSLPVPLLGYRISPGGISSQTLWKMILQWKRLDHNLVSDRPLSFGEWMAHLNKRPLLKLHLYKGFLSKSLVRSGAYCLFHGQPIRGGAYMVMGGLLQPVHSLGRLVRGM